MSTTLSTDWAAANTEAGPYWALNSTWNNGGLVNGTDYTQTITMDDPNSPNNNTTISWTWPNTPPWGMVYAYPGVFYGTYGNIIPNSNVTPERIDDLKTLTLSANLSFSGETDHYDAIYDMYLTSQPDGNTTTGTHEIEVWAHTPSYAQQWIQSLPQHTFTAADGMQWTIALSAGSNPPIVLFVPSDFRDLTNATIDFKALLKAAEADGLISGNEYFDGIGLGNEASQGSGSMTIHSFKVNYDGDPNFKGTTGGTQAGDPPAAGNDPGTTTTTPPATDPTIPVSAGGGTASDGGGTTTASDGGGTMPGNSGGDTTAGHTGGTTTATDGGGTTTTTDGGGTTTATDGGSQTASDGGGTTTATDGGGTQTASDGGGTTTATDGGGTQTASDGGGTTAGGGTGHSTNSGGAGAHHSHHHHSNGGGTQTASDGGSTTAGGGTGHSANSGGAGAHDSHHHHHHSTGGGATTATDGGGTQSANNGSTQTANNGGTAADGGTAHGAGCDGGNAGHSHHDASHGGAINIHQDIIALLQAMQQNNTTAVKNAVTALSSDVHAASTIAPDFAHHHFEHSSHHFEHMWS